MSRRLSWLWWNMRTFSNVGSIYMAKIFHRSLAVLRTWSGASFEIVNLDNNLGTIVEVWGKHVYGDIARLAHPADVGAVVIDIGANIGAFTVFASRIIPSARIYAYEPEVRNFELLTHNIDRNGLSTRVRAHRLGVTGSRGRRQLSVAGVSSGRNSIQINQGGVRQEIECTTLADIFKEESLHRCHLLKIDCEGSEYELLLETPPEVFQKIDSIVLEWHPVPGYNIEDLRQFLVHCGYQVADMPHAPQMLSAVR